MRFASLEQDFWQLESGEIMHAQNPDTFWLPPLEKRMALTIGDIAKLSFLVEGEDADGQVHQGYERMWVMVSELLGNRGYVGILGNDSAYLTGNNVYLRVGSEIYFQAEHVLDIDRPAEEAIALQLAQGPKQRWPREA